MNTLPNHQGRRLLNNSDILIVMVLRLSFCSAHAHGPIQTKILKSQSRRLRL